MEAQNYDDAVAECVDFERELKINGYDKTVVAFSETSTDYSIGDAVVKYREYMSGDSNYAHLKRTLHKVTLTNASGTAGNSLKT